MTNVHSGRVPPLGHLYRWQQLRLIALGLPMHSNYEIMGQGGLNDIGYES